LNEAPTLFDLVSLTVHVGFVDVQAKPQRLNVQPGAAFAFRLTFRPLRAINMHLPGQLMPFGELVTFPLPLTPTLRTGFFATGAVCALASPSAPASATSAATTPIRISKS
jgi:hypothetical protein